VGDALDVNGDGYADLAVVGGANEGGEFVASVFVYLGSASGLATMPAITVRGVAGGFGRSVASAGDVNGDGYADLVVGADFASGDTGGAYVYLGSASGLVTTPATTLLGPAGSDGFFGFSVASAGDVNGDGYADVAVGAVGASTAYVYLGSASGLATTPSVTLTNPEGDDAGDSAFAASVASAGDVNGDGYADLVVGDDEADALLGSAYVYLGSATGLSSTPATTLVGLGVVNNGSVVPDSFGASVASAGDVNGDGYADVVIGAEGQGSTTEPGGAYVYLGSAAGLSSTPATSLTNPNVNTFFGAAVVSAGDLTGNGFSDLAVGAFAETPSSFHGSVYVYLGGVQGINVDNLAITLTPPASTGDGGGVDNGFGGEIFGATN
jgi:hypothetical protein